MRQGARCGRSWTWRRREARESAEQLSPLTGHYKGPKLSLDCFIKGRSGSRTGKLILVSAITGADKPAGEGPKTTNDGGVVPYCAQSIIRPRKAAICFCAEPLDLGPVAFGHEGGRGGPGGYGQGRAPMEDITSNFSNRRFFPYGHRRGQHTCCPGAWSTNHNLLGQRAPA